MPSIERPLYHYTCEHGAAGIEASGLIEVRRQPPEGQVTLTWLTDLEAPNRNALGLTSHIVQCDRLTYRFEVVEHVAVERYVDVRREFFPAYWWKELERAEGAMPMHWFVSLAPQPVTSKRKVVHG